MHALPHLTHLTHLTRQSVQLPYTRAHGKVIGSDVSAVSAVSAYEESMTCGGREDMKTWAFVVLLMLLQAGACAWLVAVLGR
jgi:hypothetical protein